MLHLNPARALTCEEFVGISADKQFLERLIFESSRCKSSRSIASWALLGHCRLIASIVQTLQLFSNYANIRLREFSACIYAIEVRVWRLEKLVNAATVAIASQLSQIAKAYEGHAQVEIGCFWRYVVHLRDYSISTSFCTRM